MRKFIGSVAALGLALVPAVSYASAFVVKDEYASSATERFEGNAYIVAGTSSVAAQVSGDLFVTGGSITVTGPVGGDIAAGGGSIGLMGAVAGDVRAAGGQINISGRVRGDLDAVGGTIHLLAGAVVDGDVSIAGGQVILDGTVNGSVSVTGGRLAVNGTVRGSVSAKLGEELSLGSGARIGGSLTYKAPRETVIGSNVTVGGPVSYEPATRGDNRGAKAAFFAALAVIFAMKTLAFLGFAALIVWRWRSGALEILQEGKDAILPSIGRGFAYTVLVPLASVLLLVSFIGSIPGALLMAAYGATMVVASVMAGMFFGAGLEMVLRKGSALHLNWGNALGGVILFSLIGLVPVVGWIVRLALTMLVFGVLAHRGVRALTR